MTSEIGVATIGLIVPMGVEARVTVAQFAGMSEQHKNFTPPPVIVTTTEACADSWESR